MDIGKGHGWKHPRAPSVKWLRRENFTDAVLAFLRSTRVGCISIRRRLPGEREEGRCEVAGSGDEGEEGGPGPPDVQPPFLSFSGDEGIGCFLPLIFHYFSFPLPSGI